jgi:2-dehydropantoate 2-reductase
MRVAVIGAGAMGALFGVALARTGAELACFDPRADVLEAIARDGLRIDGVLGERQVPARAATDPGVIEPVHLALVLVDSGATVDAARTARACLRDDGFALTLQNGIGNVERLVEALGAARVAAGITYNSGAGGAPGRPRHTNVGPTVIGEADGPASARVRDLAARFHAQGLPTTVVDDVRAHVWSKFVHNCAINPISALTGLRPGEIARSPDAAALLDAVLHEILAVVAAVGVRLPEHDAREEIHEHCWERYNRPSMLQHLLAGRRTEIDALNAALVRRAATLGVPTPVNAAIVRAVRALEAAGGTRDGPLDEAALEAAARAEPRAGRWGRVI